MANLFCRALDCGSNFSTSRQCDQHEQLMHKNLIKNAAYLLLKKIIKTNSPETLQKKILRINNNIYSYQDIDNLICDGNPEGKAMEKFMMNIVETYFAYNKDHGVKEMLKNADFKIK